MSPPPPPPPSAAMRRHLCRSAAAASLLLLLFFFSAAASTASAATIPATCYPNFSTTPPLRKFVDPLPILHSIDLSSGNQVVLGAYKILQKVHSDLPATTFYAFGRSEAEATYPGPTLEAIVGTAAHVRWENHIPDVQHMLAVDRTLKWADPRGGGVPIVAHLHGGQVKSDSDGHPDSWFTATGVTGATYSGQNYTYPNTQDPAALWYHDHTVGITRLNVFSGLMGLYIIRGGDAAGRQLRRLERTLPRGSYEIPLVIQDKEFYSNGSLQFPYGGNAVQAHPNWCAEFFGDVVIVNGRIWPYLDVEPTLYRFRLLNGANARFFTLSLSNASVPVWLIGTDGGYLHGKPVRLRPSTNDSGGVSPDMTIGPGERLDLLVDFSGLEPGYAVYLNNSAAAPYPVGFPVFDDDVNMKVVMMFRVVENATLSSGSGGGGVRGTVPKKLTGRKGRRNFRTSEADAVRTLRLIQIDNNIGSTQEVLLNNQTWTDEATETPKVGSTEIWRIVNLSNRTHPIHVHLISFLVLDEQGIDVAAYVSGGCSLDVAYGDEGSCFTEALRRPASILLDEGRVWKDTVSVAPATVTRFLLTFKASDGGAFPFNATAEPGYLWHCHMVDHEDNDMMRPMKLLPA